MSSLQCGHVIFSLNFASSILLLSVEHNSGQNKSILTLRGRIEENWAVWTPVKFIVWSRSSYIGASWTNKCPFKCSLSGTAFTLVHVQQLWIIARITSSSYQWFLLLETYRNAGVCGGSFIIQHVTTTFGGQKLSLFYFQTLDGKEGSASQQ